MRRRGRGRTGNDICPAQMSSSSKVVLRSPKACQRFVAHSVDSCGFGGVENRMQACALAEGWRIVSDENELLDLAYLLSLLPTRWSVLEELVENRLIEWTIDMSSLSFGGQ